MRDLNLEGIEPRVALPKLRQVQVGLSDPSSDGAHLDAATHSAFDRVRQRNAFGADTRVRHLIGLEAGRRGVAIGDAAVVGMQLAFCTRNVEAARRDLTRICAEVREEIETETLAHPEALALDRSPVNQGAPNPSRGIAGAIYVSCAGRGGAHFGAPSAELAIVRRALGDVPLVGFFAAGEIARRHLYGYTGVLTVFARGPD
jgi:small ligand-binding sensory domain FIST